LRRCSGRSRQRRCLALQPGCNRAVPAFEKPASACWQQAAMGLALTRIRAVASDDRSRSCTRIVDLLDAWHEKTKGPSCAGRNTLTDDLLGKLEEDLSGGQSGGWRRRRHKPGKGDRRRRGGWMATRSLQFRLVKNGLLSIKIGSRFRTRQCELPRGGNALPGVCYVTIRDRATPFAPRVAGGQHVVIDTTPELPSEGIRRLPRRL